MTIVSSTTASAVRNGCVEPAMIRRSRVAFDTPARPLHWNRVSSASDRARDQCKESGVGCWTKYELQKSTVYSSARPKFSSMRVRVCRWSRELFRVAFAWEVEL